MSAMWDTLTEIRAALAALPGVKSCKIGLEVPIVAEDYPIIRLVPAAIRPEDARGGIDAFDPLVIYYGWDLLEVDVGLEAIYQRLFEMREGIRSALLVADESPLMWQYLDTTLDEDRLPRYKLFADRYKMVERLALD